ncbi:ras-like protein family member 11B [Lepisosteus oculatus]|uniref:small monomeric GTPase n=1 Tax=Lepisosteus oculatus TaxID=7918 RepID=W5N9T5_LEPOC|nr:PREDICTED: ras-like protein family member 11B [Lepisosteus oculatus]
MKMRLIQNMSTIAEYPAPECPAGRVIKIAVIGASGVGKTALVVRFLTRRFIGDYERNSGTLYTREIQVDGEQVAIQVQDTPGVQVCGLSGEQVARSVRWADAVVLVYSVTDRQSFELVGQLHQQVRQVHPDSRVPVALVANKADLLHAKQVEPQQGLKLAGALGCAFCQVSASENYNDVHNAFHLLCRDLNKQPPPPSGSEKRRTSLIPRPKSPNMQDLKRRFKQALSAKVRTVTSV